MSGRNPKKGKAAAAGPWFRSSWFVGLVLLATGAYAALCLVGGTRPWWVAVTGGRLDDWLQSDNPGGPVGSALSLGLCAVFGALWCWAVPAGLLAKGGTLLVGRGPGLRPWLGRGLALWLITATWIAQPQGPWPAETGARYGGAAAFHLARGFFAVFGLWGGRIFLSLFLAVALILVLRPWVPWLKWVSGLVGRVGAGLSRVGRGFVSAVLWPLGLAARVGSGLGRLGRSVRLRRTSRGDAPAATPIRAGAAGAPDGAVSTAAAATAAAAERERILHPMPAAAPERGETPYPDGALLPRGNEPARVLPGAGGPAELEDYFEDEAAGPARSAPKLRRKPRGPAVLPGLELLTPAGPEVQPVSREELDAAADLLEQTLRSFGVEGEVRDVRPGPVVTTFEYQPGTGIRVNQIVQRSDDLALAMRARSIRMEAPIPGKAAVGIEIPNPKPRMVRLREVLELCAGQPRTPLTVVLGKDVIGRPVTIDVAALPHLLVAGSTGSGKSVCLNALICNLLLRNDPAQLRMVLIDPKMLEMSVYNGIPHLLLPVVTDPREALKALQWMVAQMEFRYRQLARWSVRNIQQYNEKIGRGEILDEDGQPVTEIMPYYITIVDELADLMLQLGGDMEGPITRLAQKARAVGVHLILATQRPSVDVLTGVIKANIPCRIAFRVIQKNDSRTILDMNGAEQLLGHGDMLYLQPGRALPVRVHGSFIDMDECEAIATYWRQYAGQTEEISLDEHPAGGGMVTGEDDLFDEARRIVILHQSGSTSLLQRRLRIGYTRAGRLMDMLEEAGVVGPFTGSKARDVLVKAEDFEQMNEGRA